MRVVISGGGLAGLTLAYWLERSGISVVVIEQAEHQHHEGYGLDFYGTGYDVAERMGILDRLRQQQIPVESVTYVTDRDQRIAGLDTSLMQKILHGRYLALMHRTLEEVLSQALADTIEVRYGLSMVAVEPGEDAVEVTFTDGSRESFDLLIGADGVHSQTRRLVFGPDSRFERSLGYSFACYPLADCYGVGHFRKNYTEPGRLTIAYNTEREGEIVALFLYKAVSTGPIARQQRLAHLRRIFTNMGWITQQLLADAPESEAVFLDTVTQVEMPTWHHGRVALVGDACGSLTAFSGQGASMAMGGAYILARALHEARDYDTAFLRYEQLVRPYVEKRQKHARRNLQVFLPANLLGLLAQRLLMQLVVRETFSGLLIHQFGADSLLEHV